MRSGQASADPAPERRPAMRIGVALTQRYLPGLANVIERLGFESLWVGGHLLWHTPMLDPLSQLAAYAGVTSRIRLGTSVLILPLHHPVALAKVTSTIDIISDGRLVLGVGVGGENPAEFEALGVPLKQRGRRADESIAALRAIWSGKPATSDGPYFPLRGVEMSPRPATPSGPPIWIAGRSPAALTRAGRYGDGWLGIFLSPRRYQEAAEQLQSECVAAGRPGDAVTRAHYLWVRVGSSRERADDEARQYLQRSYGRPFAPDQLQRFCAAGAADDVGARLSQYADAGCEHLVVKVAGTPDEIGDQVTRLATTVLHLAPAG